MRDDGDRLSPANRDDEQRAGVTGPTPPSGARHSTEQPPAVTRRRRPVPMMLGGLVAVAVIAAAATTCSGSTSDGAEAGGSDTAGQAAPAHVHLDGAPVIAPRQVDATEMATLPQATTFGVAPGAPRDPAPEQAPTNRVVRVHEPVPVFASPGGAPVAVVPAQQPIGIAPDQTSTDTWLPVLEERPGWALVALPLRPNGSVAWLFIDTEKVTVSSTPNLVIVDRAAYQLTLLADGEQVGRWTVGVGKPGSVTPAGRTFLLAAIRDTKAGFSPIVLPLGAHSDTHQTYGGGPGTVGVHTWPSADVYGKPSSDGCVRVPPEALQVLTTVPLGTAVLIK